RRLDDPDDFVRLEIETALKRDIAVIPVLVGRARMPKAAQLPESLRELAYRNGLEVRRDPDFHPDVDRLIRGLTGLLGARTPGEAVDFPLPGGLKMAFCWVPPGTAQLGSPITEEDREDTETEHQFTTRGFWLGKCPVTQAEWQALAGNN